MKKFYLFLAFILAFQGVSHADPTTYSRIVSGRTVVDTAGTAKALSTDTSIYCKAIHVSAPRANTAEVYIGASNVLATVGNQRGVSMYSRDTVVIPMNSLSSTFIDARVSGEGVTYDCYQ